MSTAAPAAGASAPVAPAAPAANTGEPTAPQATAARSIKPIPSRLPGVLEDGPEDASTPDAIAARARDARGRFTADGTPIVAKGERPSQTPESAPDEPVIPDAPDAKPKFRFNGREFDSQEAAEHYVKSMEGRYKPVQEKATKSEAELARAAESARGWHAEAQRLAAEIESLRAGGGSPTPAADGTSAPAPAGIDWGLYAEIAKVAQEAGEPWKAQQWLQEQVDAQRAADIAALREEAIENPRREAEAQTALAQTADTLVTSMAEHTNPDGSPAFPEFQNGEQAREVGELWRSLGLDPHLALTPGGAVAAVALYRMARGMDAAAPIAPNPNPVPPSPPSNPAADAAAGLDGGRPLMPAAMSRRELDPTAARIIAGLKNTQLIQPRLGFEA